MTLLLVIAGAWLGLVLLLLGGLHVATSTAIPRPVSPIRMALVGDAQMRGSEQRPSYEAPRRALLAPTEAA